MIGVVTFVCVTIYAELLAYNHFRQDYLRLHSSSLSAKTILITGIPKDLLTVDDLLRIYGPFPGGVEAVVMNRDVPTLTKMIQQREETLNILETAETELIRKALKAKAKASDHDGKSGPLSKRYLREQDRPTVRLPILSWLPSLPLLGAKVDVISHFRRSLAHLNVELNPSRIPKVGNRCLIRPLCSSGASSLPT